MKKTPNLYDQEIDSFLKCEKEIDSLRIDDEQLAGQIHLGKNTAKLNTKFLRFFVPMAACFAVLYFSFSDSFERNSEAKQILAFEPLIQPSSPSSQDLGGLDVFENWVFMSEDLPHITAVNYDSSYELLLTLESLTLP